ncbi:putative baseplate assembly protein [Crocosphaera sp.]|uniref:putative baseplate assembly protein n=1 Tax=Crocosphaera sp. TaxID=2729996 RepID=UPI00260DDAFD|nr:putative baseplate assembly protein [Crocosphaera sp.]MDJ0579760.1 putative baseplate assembly protein [Crocosphaera sp.]
MRDQTQQRKVALKNKRDAQGVPLLNGIDYVEIGEDGQTLFVHFIHNLSQPNPKEKRPTTADLLKQQNLVITNVKTLETVRISSIHTLANLLIIRVKNISSLGTYRLRLVNNTASTLPPQGFDPQLSQIEFSLRRKATSEFDCQDVPPIAEKQPPPPTIDYLAKDYQSFRTLMLDRLAVTIPQWQERNPADLGIMLVELFAYIGDRLSYYQDAVATEAYLGTARKRISIRRHSRLLDYFIHEGCNARAWVIIELNENSQDEIKLLGPSVQENRPGVKFLTQTSFPQGNLKEQDLQTALNEGAQVFEAMHDITLYHSLNTIEFYTWGNEDYSLPKGATTATLKDEQRTLYKDLREGSVLVIENQLNPVLNQTHLVRLTQVTHSYDPLFDTALVTIEWDEQEALPFDVPISRRNDQGKLEEKIYIARGNVVLVDAGRTLSQPEPLWKNPGWDSQQRPRLQEEPLTHQGRVYLSDRQRWGLFDAKAPAKNAMEWELRDARPAIYLVETKDQRANRANLPKWSPQPDLLNSDRFAREFVVETEEDRRTYLRFGDGMLGKKPQQNDRLEAVYRIGNGIQGNVGAEAIKNIILPKELEKIKLEVRNPLPAQGGQEPEPIEEVRLYAPQAFREQKRAVTEKDYEKITETYPGVQKALATRHWTGSWHTIFISVDRQGGRRIDEAFEQGLLAFLEPFRLAGQNLEIEQPLLVSLDIAMTVTIEPDYFQDSVKEALLDTFSNSILEDGVLGFFHPDRFTFGQPVYLSQLIARAMEVTGVRSVKVTRFQRQDQPSILPLETGNIQFERLEIAQLDNNPNVPENGTLQFNLEGGL